RVYTTSYAQLAFPTGHAQFLGRINPALRGGRQRLASADVVLAVGTNVFSGFFYSSQPCLAPSTALIHVDSASHEIGKVEPTRVGVVGDPRLALQQLSVALGREMSAGQQETARARAEAVAGESRKQREAWQARVRERW